MPSISDERVTAALKMIADHNTEKHLDEKLKQLIKNVSAHLDFIYDHYYIHSVHALEMKLCEEIKKATGIGGGLGWGPLNSSLNALVDAIENKKPITEDTVLKFFTPEVKPAVFNSARYRSSLFKLDRSEVSETEPLLSSKDVRSNYRTGY